MKKMKNLYEPMKKYWFKVFASGLAVMVVAGLFVALNGWSITRAEYTRLKELIAMGYSNEVASDQCYEEFHNIDGLSGTGGIDGKYLDGTPATGVPGSSGGGGTSTPTEPKHAHTWEQTSLVEETCLEQGVIVYTCSGCGKTKEEKIPIGDHDFETIEDLPATCLSPRHITYKCKVCGELDYAEFGEKLDHNYIPSNENHDATCTEGGYFHYVCSACGDEYTETTEPLGHNYADSYTEDKKATCTEEGMKSVHCKRCDAIEEGSEVVIPMVEHKGETKIVPATFFQDGLESNVCKDCGKVLSETVFPSRANELGGLPFLIGVGVGGIVVIVLIVVGVVVLARRKKKQ